LNTSREILDGYDDLSITKAHKQTAHALKEDLQFIVEQILNGTLGITIYVLPGFE